MLSSVLWRHDTQAAVELSFQDIAQASTEAGFKHLCVQASTETGTQRFTVFNSKHVSFFPCWTRQSISTAQL